MDQDQERLGTFSRRSTGLRGGNTLAQSQPQDDHEDDEIAARLAARLRQYVAEPTMIISETAMNHWKAQLKDLTELERMNFVSHSKGNFLDYVNHVEGICKTRGDASKGGKVAKLFRPWFRTVNQYAPIARTMIQSDPSSAALALGAITCVMAISERYLDFSDKIIEMLANMGEKNGILMEYGSEVYQNNDSVQVAIVKVFADVLQFCRKVLPLYRDENNKQRKSGKNFLKSLHTSFDEYFEDILKTYNLDLHNFEERALLCDRKEIKRYREVDAAVSQFGIMNIAQLKQDLSSMKSTINNELEFFSRKDEHDKAREAAERQKQEQEEQKLLRENVMTWIRLSSVDFHVDQNNKVRDRLEGTGKWVLEHHDYIQWKLSVEGRPLWIQGKLGCGKSFLTSIIVQDLKSICEDTENMNQDVEGKTAFAFVYCTSLESNKSDLSKLLCSLIEQLSYQLPTPMIDSYLETKYKQTNGSRPLDLNELKLALESLLAKFKIAYLVVDGLDELRFLAKETFDEHCMYFGNLARQQRTVRLLATSRPGYSAIEIAFASCSRISMDQGRNKSDIEKVIDKKLNRIGLHQKHKPEVLEYVRTELLSRAQGMFLWVDLVVDSLRGMRNSNKLREKVMELPRGLYSQYSSYMDRIRNQNDNGDFAFKILLWIANAQRPLTHAELLNLLAVQPATTDIDEGDIIEDDIDLCGDCENLVVFDGIDQTYNLLHSSLKDYLSNIAAGTTDMPNQYRVLQQNVDIILAQTCLTFLGFDRFARGPARTPKDLENLVIANPFLSYASIHWAMHVANAKDERVRAMTIDFVMKPGNRDLSMQLLWHDREHPLTFFVGQSNALHVLASYGLYEIATDVPNWKGYLAEKDRLSRYPFDCAVARMQRKTCNWILDATNNKKSPRLSEVCRPESLNFAAYRGWFEVVEKLIDRGLDVRTTIGSTQHSVLHFAIANNSHEVLRVLLKTDVDLNAQDEEGCTALWYACATNQSSIVEMLIAAGADVCLPGESQRTPLHESTSAGNLRLTHLLVEKGADVNATAARGFRSTTPLHLAAMSQNQEVLQFLIEAGGSLDAVDVDLRTPLHYACIYGHHSTVALLLSSEISIETLDANGNTSIHFAASNGHVNVLEVLFSQKPVQWTRIINLVNARGRTALHDAVMSGSLDTVRFLSQHGSLQNTTNLCTQCPIHLAMSDGQAEIVDFLFRYDPKCLEWRGLLGGTLLHYVGQIGHHLPESTRLMESFLAAGADPEAPGDNNVRPVHVAMLVGNLRFVEDLYGRKPDLELNALTKGLQSPLHMAAGSGRKELVQWLLDHGSNTAKSADKDGDLPLHIAAMKGYADIVQLLLTQEIKDFLGSHGRTALFMACSRGHLEVAQLLLKQGADPNIKDEDLDNALVTSIVLRHDEIAHLLLDHNVDLLTTTGDGTSALMVACFTGKLALVKKLISLGIDTTLVDVAGNDAFWYALMGGNHGVVRYLIDADLVNWTSINSAKVTCFHKLAVYGDSKMLKENIDRFDAEDRKAFDVFGRNAIWFAALFGHAELIKELYTAGVTIPIVDSPILTPLQEAASYGYVDSVRMILELQNDTSVVDQASVTDRQTALHKAALHGYPLICQILLAAGANPYLKDCFGLSAFNYMTSHPQRWNEDFDVEQHGLQRYKTVSYPAVRENACQQIKLLLTLPDRTLPRDNLRRALSLANLALALCILGSSQSLERAKICFFELSARRPSDDHQSSWLCSICGAQNIGVSMYMCVQSIPGPGLCKACYHDYKEGEKDSNNVPQSLIVLEELEKAMLPVQRVIREYRHLGTEFIIGVWEASSICTDNFFHEKQTGYREWKEAYNNKGRFAPRKTKGYTFLKWLEKALNVVKYRRERVSSTSANGRNEALLSQDNQLSVSDLDQELETFFKDNRLDQETYKFACQGHEFLKPLEVNELTEEQKSCFDTKWTITRTWLQQLNQWLESLSFPEDSSMPQRSGENSTKALDLALADLVTGNPATSVHLNTSDNNFDILLQVCNSLLEQLRVLGIEVEQDSKVNTNKNDGRQSSQTTTPVDCAKTYNTEETVSTWKTSSPIPQNNENFRLGSYRITRKSHGEIDPAEDDLKSSTIKQVKTMMATWQLCQAIYLGHVTEEPLLEIFAKIQSQQQPVD